MCVANSCEVEEDLECIYTYTEYGNFFGHGEIMIASCSGTRRLGSRYGHMDVDVGRYLGTYLITCTVGVSWRRKVEASKYDGDGVICTWALIILPIYFISYYHCNS